ncbi:MAG: FkbM family methyltransferase [Thermodesulfobacteriota bacterium]
MNIDVLKESAFNTVRALIKFVFGKKCISLKGDSNQPFHFPPAEYPSLLAGVRRTYTQPYDQWESLLRRGDTIFDIGANIGIATQAFYSILKGDCTIFSFEPIPRNFKLLQLNCQELHAHSITLVNSAVGNYDGDAIFYDNTTFGSLSGLAQVMKTKQKDRDDWREYEELKVHIIKIDTFLNKNNGLRPNFVKIDVEGAGHLVLEGMSGMLATSKPLFSCEFHSKEEKEGIRGILKEMGYKGILFPGAGKILICQPENSNGNFIHPTDARITECYI